jgi:hypothetical protein
MATFVLGGYCLDGFTNGHKLAQVPIVYTSLLGDVKFAQCHRLCRQRYTCILTILSAAKYFYEYVFFTLP